MEKNIKDIKKKAILRDYGIDNVSIFIKVHTIEHPSSITSQEREQTSLKSFINNLEITVIDKEDPLDLTFDIKGIEAPYANALRRIMIAEVPTMAIEKVGIWQNTSIFPDEVLAHRMGLIPIEVDPRLFENVVSNEDSEQLFNESNSIKFKLHVRCTKKDPKQEMPLNVIDEDKYFNNASVYSSHLEWVPIGKQKNMFKTIRPVHEDILIAKLRPGQEIEMEMTCTKGNGAEHAKWSPVCTAYYRLVPAITILKPIKGEAAQLLKKTCPMKVFDIEDSDAYVKNPRNCTSCRECIIRDDFKDMIEVAKEKDNFEFHVESVGQYQSKDIVIEAIKVLTNKCETWLEAINEYNQN